MVLSRMARSFSWVLPVLLAACAPAGESSDGTETDGGETGAETGDGDGETGEGMLELPAPGLVDGEHFATSQLCADCHDNQDGASAMRDEADRPIAPDELWQATMMANAARDPFWWAMVTAETLATPAAKELIEAKCMRCHAPMAHDEAPDAAMPRLAWLLEGDDRSRLGLDGVSCTVCHQVEPEGLGTKASFSGGWSVGDQRRIFGPHADPFAMPMVGHSGFTPVEAAHMVDSGTCATCHTLFTDAVDADAKPIGSHFPEQTPYLEWRNSAYSTESEPAGMQAATCQDCHVPTQSVDGVPISTRIAHRPDGSDFPSISDRAPVGRHVFVGGNTLMPAIIDANAADLQPRAGSEAFSAVIDAARDQLANRTAEVSIVDVVRDGDLVRVQVRVDVETGHKFPTGFPSRRAWLKVAVVDAGETTIFESGGFDGEGRIVDAGGSPLAAEAAGGPVLGHRDRIDDASQVQVYEAIMSDAEGQAAYRLLRATEYLKDNRVLPVGWSSDGPHADETAPAGVDDDDFVGGSDVVTYEIQAPAAAGPYQLRVELLYQPLGARFAAELFELSAPEIEAFESMFDAADKSPVQVSSVSQQVQ